MLESETTIQRFAGRYELLRRIGSGGMGEIFLARDRATGAECALKRLRPARGMEPAELRREFQMLTRLRHPCIVAVLDLGFAPDGAPFYTMEYVPGLRADEAFPSGRRHGPELLFVAAEVARGLEALHSVGVVHGDLKPSNLLVVLSPDAKPVGVRLLDFGLASITGARSGGGRGTPGFAAPEVVRGDPPSPSADLYGLGALLYALISGHAPFAGESSSSLLMRQQQGPPDPEPLEEAQAPPGLIRLVLSLMASDPSERPRDAHEVRREIERMHPAVAKPLEDRLRTVIVVGREKELARLERLLADPGERARVVVLDGEAGIGKSALLESLAARLSLDGRTVIRLACGMHEGSSSSALALCRRLEAEARAGVLPSGISENARRLLEGVDTVPSEEDLAILAEAAVSWQRMIMARGGKPVVLLDDTDRLDQPSRSFVRRLVLHPQSPPTVWVWTRRDVEDVPEDERMLQDVGVLAIQELASLSCEDVVRLASARLHEPAPESLCDFLWSATRGHPGLAVELMMLAAGRGAITETEAGLIADPESLRSLDVSTSFEESLGARIANLPVGARHAADALAILRTNATLDRVQAMDARVDHESIMLLTEAGLVTHDPLLSQFSFVSPALADRWVQGMDAATRARLHRAALTLSGLSASERFRHLRGAGEFATALEAASAAFEAFPDIGLAESAAQLAEERAPEQAPEWHERAGRELASLGRYQAAFHHFERAIALDREGPRVERLHLLSTAYLRAGMLDRVKSTVAEALAENPSPAQRSRLLGNESARLTMIGDPEGSRRVALEGLEIAEKAGDEEGVGIAAQSLVYSLLMLRRSEEADRFARRAAEAFAKTGNRLGQIRALGARAAVAQAQHDHDTAERLYLEALDTARKLGLRVAVEEVLNNLASVLSDRGQWQAMRERYAEAARLALEDHRPRGAAVAIANLAQLDGLVGNAPLAIRRARSAIRMTRRHAPWLEPLGWRSLAQGFRIAGRAKRAERAARRALNRAIQSGSKADLEWCRVEFARTIVAQGRWPDAGEFCERAMGEEGSDGSAARSILVALAGRAALRRGDLVTARERLAAAEEQLGRESVPYPAACVGQLRAELALVEKGIADGASQAEKTMESFRALSATPDRAAAMLEFARLALNAGAGFASPLLEALDHAVSTFERLGDHRGRERALALQVQWLRRISMDGPAGGRDRSLIESVSHLISSLSDLSELTQRAMAMLVEQLDAERGVLLLIDPETGRPAPMAEHGAVDATMRRDAVGYSRQIVQRVADSGGSILIRDASSNPRELSDSMRELRLRSILCVPMHVGGRVIGAVYLDDSRRPQAFEDADRGLLEGFAHLMGIAIEKSRGQAEVERTNELLVGENLSLRQQAAVRFQPHRLIGGSSEMNRVMAMVERAALTNTTVFLTGENGTGKELIARILHHSGKRRHRPFVAVNCGAIPETLLESELFGILPNVATGVRGREGRFQQADGGTLFLDEIGDMPLKQQVALLAALASREVTPVGGGKAIPVDVRIIAATNRDIRHMVDEGTFREDLFYRLSVIPLHVPPLRERKADIPSLAQHFVAHFARVHERDVPELPADFLGVLMQSDWPGNVRELQNYIERVMAMNPGRVLHPIPLPRDLEERSDTPRLARGRRLTEMVEDLERRLIEQALAHAEGNQSLAARQLGVPEQTIRYRIRKYGLLSSRQKRRIRSKWR